MDKFVEEYYTFISYKHFDESTGHFKDDARWAIGVAKQLQLMRIPVDVRYPIADKCFINLNPRDETVFPVFRDEISTSSETDLNETIKKALAASRSLTVIVSKAMLKDQRDKIARGEKAWCFAEIEEFIQLGHPKSDIYVVYIENATVTSGDDIIPDPLKEEGKELKPICVHEYTHESGKTLSKVETEAMERSAAAVASKIFNSKPELFWSYRKQEKKRRKMQQMLGLIIGATLLIFLGIALLWGRFLRSNHLITQAQVAADIGDSHAAELFGLQSLKGVGTFNSRAYDYLRGFVLPRKYGKASVVKTWVEFSDDGNRLCFYEADKSGRFIKILSTADFSEIKRIPYPYSAPKRVIPDHEMNRIAVLDWDSLRVFNVENSNVIRTAFIDAGSDAEGIIYGFSADNHHFISQRWNNVLFVNLFSEQIDSLSIEHGVEHEFKLTRGNLILKIADSDSVRFYLIEHSPVRKTLLASDCPGTGTRWDYCPETRTLAYTTSSGIALLQGFSKTEIAITPELVNAISISPYSGITAIERNDSSLNIMNRNIRYVSSGSFKWISPSEFKYRTIHNRIVIENVISGDEYYVNEDLELPSVASNERFFFSYESCANSETIIGGYLGPSRIRCIKYNRPSEQENAKLKEHYYFNRGRLAISVKERPLGGTYIGCYDVENHKLLWEDIRNYHTSSRIVQSIDQKTGTAIIQDKGFNSEVIINLKTGEIVHTLNGWGSHFVGNDYIAAGVKGKEEVQIIKKNDFSVVATLEGNINDLIILSDRYFIIPQLGNRAKHVIYDCVTSKISEISDNLSDKHDVSISDDGKYFVTHGIDRSGELGDLRRNYFRVYDLEKEALVYEDSLCNHIRRSTVLNNNTLCFVLEDGVAFFDIRKRKLTAFHQSSFEIGYTSPIKVSENKYLVNVLNDGVYEIDLRTQRFRKSHFSSDGTTVSLFDKEFLHTGGWVYNYYTGDVYARKVNNVVRIDGDYIYFTERDNIEQRIPILNNNQLITFIQQDVGARVLSTNEINYYQNMN